MMDAKYFRKCWYATSGSEFDPYCRFDNERLHTALIRLHPKIKNVGRYSLMELCIYHLMLPANSICRGATRMPISPYNAFSLALSVIDHAALRNVLKRVFMINLIGWHLTSPESMDSLDKLHECLLKVDKDVANSCFYGNLGPDELPPKLSLLTQEWITNPPVSLFPDE